MESESRMFARKRHDGNYNILDNEGYPITRIYANVYPVGSNFSTQYKHPEGIILSLEDVQKLNIKIEGKTKPKCKLIGADGSVFYLIGLACMTLKRAGLFKEAKEMCSKCLSSGSYDETMGIISDYVEIL